MRDETYRVGKDSFTQYVIARRAGSRFELLRISIEAGVEALPVFSLEDLAWKFLRYHAPGSDWHVRKSSTGELVSLLLGPCADIPSILPNPFPNPLAAREALLNGMDRESFLAGLTKGPLYPSRSESAHWPGHRPTDNLTSSGDQATKRPGG